MRPPCFRQPCRPRAIGRDTLCVRPRRPAAARLLGFFGGRRGFLGGLRVGLRLLLLRLCAPSAASRARSCSASRAFSVAATRASSAAILASWSLARLRVVAVRILRQEGVQCVLVADLQRQFVVTAHLGLRAGHGVDARSFGAAPAARRRRRASHRQTAPAGCRWSCRTSSRTNPNALRTSSPGVVMCCASAVVNGLFFASPSSAVEPALAE